METSNRYIIVSNSGRGRHKAFKILDLERMELLPDVYDRKPFDQCLALNKKKNGVTVIEHAPEVEAAQPSTPPSDTQQAQAELDALGEKLAANHARMQPPVSDGAG